MIVLSWAGRPYFNGGMWWGPTAMLAAARRGVRNALKTGRRYIFHNDQDALNLWLLASGSVHAVPRRFNTFELARFLERSDWPHRYTPRSRTPNDTDAVLLHFVGSAKPWLPSTPFTQYVRLYRNNLNATLRQVQQLGDLASTPLAGDVVERTCWQVHRRCCLPGSPRYASSPSKSALRDAEHGRADGIFGRHIGDGRAAGRSQPIATKTTKPHECIQYCSLGNEMS